MDSSVFSRGLEKHDENNKGERGLAIKPVDVVQRLDIICNLHLFSFSSLDAASRLAEIFSFCT
jgi:hypothetical protein